MDGFKYSVCVCLTSYRLKYGLLHFRRDGHSSRRAFSMLNPRSSTSGFFFSFVRCWDFWLTRSTPMRLIGWSLFIGFFSPRLVMMFGMTWKDWLKLTVSVFRYAFFAHPEARQFYLLLLHRISLSVYLRHLVKLDLTILRATLVIDKQSRTATKGYRGRCGKR